MRYPIPLTLLLAVVFAAAVGAARAAEPAGDPMKIVLQEHDLPAKADYSSLSLPARTVKGLASIGVRATGATFHASLPVSSTKALSYDGVLFVTGSMAQAAKLYALSVREARKRPNKTTALRLPRYGDTQFARSFVDASTVELLVRTKSVVWTLQIGGTGLLVRSEAELTAELRKYAARQARRVGAG
jgi:hypothetical protein